MAIKAWWPKLSYYEELIGVESHTTKDFQKIMHSFYSRELITCPRKVGGHEFIVPKEALVFLSLEDVKCKITELREEYLFAEEVRKKISDNDYYHTGRGYSRTCHRGYVPLATIQKIEKLLGISKEDSKIEDKKE